MKKQVRRTVAALFMASAIAVAAIPVEPIQATNYGDDNYKDSIKVAVYDDQWPTTNIPEITSYKSSVPYASEGGYNDFEKTVYSTGDGEIQFVYLDPSGKGGSNKCAIVMGYRGDTLDGGNYTIPDKVTGFLQYYDNQGGDSGYCAVNRSGKFLFWKTNDYVHDINNGYKLNVSVYKLDSNGVRVVPEQTEIIEVYSNDSRINGTYENFVFTRTERVRGEQQFDIDGNPILDPSNNTVYELIDKTVEYSGKDVVMVKEIQYKPCFYSTYDSWKDIDQTALFYSTKDDYIAGKNPTACTQDADYIISAEVKYIGNEVIADDGKGGFKITGTVQKPTDGVFAAHEDASGGGNIVNLTIPNTILGIGNYAFYGCGNLTSVTFGDGIRTLGNGAFENCMKLTSVYMPENANIRCLGMETFKNCQKLTTCGNDPTDSRLTPAVAGLFNLPSNIEAIGDQCFKGCTSLTNIDMEDGALRYMGYHVFQDCKNLTSLTFPDNNIFEEIMDIDLIKGCTSLQYVCMKDPLCTFVENHKDNKKEDDTAGTFSNCRGTGNSFGFDELINSETLHVPETFYFEGPGLKNVSIKKTSDSYTVKDDNNKLHDTSLTQNIPFKYLDEDIYEKCVIDTNSPNDYAAIYRVDNGNNLVKFTSSGTLADVILPDQIGPYGISTIGPDSFSDNCDLQRISIPYTVNRIEDDAFKGCHNLNSVIFKPNSAGAYNYGITIGTDSFKTQEVSTAKTCTNHATGAADDITSYNGHTLYAKDDDFGLKFVGPISNSNQEEFFPYTYAMNSANNINEGGQPTTFITYVTDIKDPVAPMMEIELKRDALDDATTGEFTYYRTLVGYPSWEDLKELKSASSITPDLLKKYPFITDDGLAALSGAVDAYNAQQSTGAKPKEDQQAIINASRNPVIPNGVQAIEDGLFSGIQADGTQLKDSAGNDIEPDKDIETITIYSVETIDPYTFYGCSGLTAASVMNNKEIGDYSFAGADKLETFYLQNGDKMGDYVFDGDKALSSVTIDGLSGAYTDANGQEAESMGIRPFRGCESLMDVTFNTPNYTSDKGIIYSGDKTKIYECLESRGTKNSKGLPTVEATETSKVTKIMPEAFMDCDDIIEVQLGTSSIKEVPERCFADTDELGLVSLPKNCSKIGKDAFIDGKKFLKVEVPNTNAYCVENAFSETVNGGGYSNLDQSSADYNPYKNNSDVNRNITVYTTSQYFWDMSNKDENGNTQKDGLPYLQASMTAIKYDVSFYDGNPDGAGNQLWDSYEVESGQFAHSPVRGNPTGKTKSFKAWTINGTEYDPATYTVTGTTVFTASYIGDEYTVTFYLNKDAYKNGDAPLSTLTVPSGTVIGTSGPTTPDVPGYEFDYWEAGTLNLETDPITSDVIAWGIWLPVSEEKIPVHFMIDSDRQYDVKYVLSGQGLTADEYPTGKPEKSGYTFNGWLPSSLPAIYGETWVYADMTKNSSGGSSTGGGGTDGGKTDGGGSTSGETKKTYTVTVINGSGSGTYEEGKTVIVAANTPATGKAFKNWTTSDVTLVSYALSATSFTMPGKNVTVTANYVDATTTTVKTASGNSARPVSTGQTAVNPNVTGSTAVQVSKGGVSSVDLASATVRGSNDSFVVKVTENNEATTAVANALNNRYGSLDGIEYWACDISLYDSTGNTKISDTTGLQVDITLPLPDGLKQYGGNNRAGAVSNNQLEDLNTKFNTINGTPTITFTANHFSPYVIYVDTNNLDAGQMLDASPKTGDPIHPKWFLSIGLAAASIVLFLKKDKKRVKVATV